MSTNRNRWLLAALGLVVVFYFGDLAYRRFYEEPTQKNERALEQLSKKLRAAQVELKRSTQVVDQLEGLEQKSLPWDADMARARYQDWLLQLAKSASNV